MTSLLDRLRARSTSTPTVTDSVTAARTRLGPYLDACPLAPWGPDVRAALDDVAVLWARREELRTQHAAATQQAADARTAAVDALVGGGVDPDAVRDLTGAHEAHAAALAEAADRLTPQVDAAARELVRRQAVELTDRARARHADAAEVAADVAHLLDALQDAAGVTYVPDTLAPGIDVMSRVDRLMFEARDLTAQAVAAAVVAAGAPLGSVNGQEGAAPRLATTAGTGALPPLVVPTTSAAGEAGGFAMPYTEPDADRTRITEEVTAAVLGRPVALTAPDGPPVEYVPPVTALAAEAGPWTPPTATDDAQGAAAWAAAVAAEQAAGSNR